MTVSMKANRMPLHTPEASSMLKDMNDSVEFVTKMEELLSEESKGFI